MTQSLLTARIHSADPPAARLMLPFELRQRSRMLATLDNGEEVGVTLPRGTILRGGDRLQSSDGRVIEVVASPETVSIVRSADVRLLARAAYHLGNRHVAVQIASGFISYLHDHVLDDMLRGLGLAVEYDLLPFEPEAGAYSQSHAHAHASHGHTHGHGHDHSHG
ncbi:MAG: urease accessory protein UreE [Steroidobacteraceae bacterium]